MPPNPPSNAHGFAMRSMSLCDMQIPKSEKKISWPPPPKSWGRPCERLKNSINLRVIYILHMSFYIPHMLFIYLTCHLHTTHTIYILHMCHIYPSHVPYLPCVSSMWSSSVDILVLFGQYIFLQRSQQISSILSALVLEISWGVMFWKTFKSKSRSQDYITRVDLHLGDKTL